MFLQLYTLVILGVIALSLPFLNPTLRNTRVRWLKGAPLALVVSVSILLASGTVAAVYTIITLTGEVTVSEAISVTPTTFTVSMYPAETVTQTLTLSNAGSVAIEVNFTWSISPIDSEITMTVPAKVTVPATGSATVAIDIKASKSAVPGTYSVSIGVIR